MARSVSNKPRLTPVILAGGMGKRMGEELRKRYEKEGDKMFTG